MSVYLRWALLFFVVFTSSCSNKTTDCTPVRLQCEHLDSPIGIDARTPRFAWELDDKRPGAQQSAYQILLSTDSLLLSQRKVDQWKTQKIRSNIQQVVYSGKPLKPFSRYYWLVKIWDQDGNQAESHITSFETGMLGEQNWKGAWISDNHDEAFKPAAYFRRGLILNKKVKSARAYIAAAGLFELYVNGKLVGDDKLQPSYTRFDKRVLYVTHDVTANFHPGSNVIAVHLGNGWYNHQSVATWNFHKAQWRNRPVFCMDVRITYEDGTEEIVKTEKGWKTTQSPVVFNSIYTGEHYNACKEIANWNMPDCDDSKWEEVIIRPAPTGNIVAQALHPVRVTEEIAIKSFKKINDRLYVFSFERNIAGVCQITVNTGESTILKLKHGEILDSTGRVDQSNVDIFATSEDGTDPFMTDIFITKGVGDESFSPRFNYKGFQYVEVSSNKPVELTKESLKAYFMHSDVPAIGSIKTSSPIINDIWKATNNSYLSNLFGYPTDCPQREKNGWTGDGHIAIETALYNFDAITIYEKWLADHRDAQEPNGSLPAIIPTGSWGYEWANGVDWTSSLVIIPWNIYLFYGDSKLLADCYNSIKRYVDLVSDKSASGITNWGLGDWMPIKSKASIELTSTAYYYTDVVILSEAAKILGKQEDHEKYQKLAQLIRASFNEKFLNTSTGIYASGCQTELAIPLQWGLVPAEYRQKVADNLAKRVMTDGYQLDVGLLGSKAILNALSENGYADLAYGLAINTKAPSWAWWLTNGSGSLYESWAGGEGSRNHIMLGEVSAWFYKALGGLKPDPAKPGFKHIILEPHFVKELEEADMSFKSPYGIIGSVWKKTSKEGIYTTTIPANTTATLTLAVPAKKWLYFNKKKVKLSNGEAFKFELTAGVHSFEWK